MFLLRGDVNRSSQSGIQLTKSLPKWRDAMKPVYAQFEPGIGKDTLDAALASNKAKTN